MVQFKHIRMIIYPKDVQVLTGKSYRQSLRLYQRAKAYFGKSKHDLLSFEEFCRCYKLPLTSTQESSEMTDMGQKISHL